MITIDGYSQFGSHHWETGSIRNVLAHEGVTAPHTGQPFSEAMLLGLSGGVAVMYFIFEYEGYPPHLALGTRYPFNAIDQVVDRLKLQAESKQTSSQKKAVDNLLSALVVGTPVMVWADMFTLSYNALPPSAFPGMMPIVVFAYGIEEGMVAVADRSRVPLTTTTGELAEARARQNNVKNRIMTLDFDEEFEGISLEMLAEAVQAGIADCISLYTQKPPKGSANNFGLKALDRWAGLINDRKAKKGWPKVFTTPEHLYEALKALYIAIEQNGTGGAASRNLYADFLDEASVVLDRPALNDAADAFRASAERWTELAATALPESIVPLRETRGLLEQSHTLFKERGDQAREEMLEIGARMAALKTQVTAMFPLPQDEIYKLLDSLSECISGVLEAETAAVEALQEAMS